MSIESREFIQLRNDIYAAELSKCPEPVTVEPDVSDIECEACNGEGATDDGTVCPKCRGAGVI